MADAPIPFKQFLETAPPLETHSVSAVAKLDQHANVTIALPPIFLYCGHPECGGFRYFDPTDEELTVYRLRQTNFQENEYARFLCRNCQTRAKTFALFVAGNTSDLVKLNIMKYGEHPRFGEPRPNSVKTVLDDEIEFFDRGYRAETAGLGIGAFAYYRRFVESHKDKIIAEIRKVAVAQGAKPEIIETLDRAAAMNSFDQAVKTVKDAIPDSLKYGGGHNPLTLLHTALSQGLHNDDDADCLTLAKDIRLVLTDLADRTTQALKDNTALSQAVNRLLQKNSRT
ncbi:MAG TPA: hypothetical protein VK624_15165 [Steroidobacteraceae bacterium]|nr:hypothetical protein [Steroidobacteraceae bacterium]